VAFSPDGALLATGGADQLVRVWDAATGKELRQLQGHTGVVWGVAFEPSGSRLASVSGDRTVKVWDAATAQELRTLAGHLDLVRDVVWGQARGDVFREPAESGCLFTAGHDHTVRIWRPIP
jgi:WD40 repeat protein